MKILFVVEHFPALSRRRLSLTRSLGLIDLGHDVTVYAVGKPSGVVTHPDVEKYGLMARTLRGADVPVSKAKRVFDAMRQFPALFRQCGLRAFSSLNPLRHGKSAIHLGFFYTCLAFLGLRQNLTLSIAILATRD